MKAKSFRDYLAKRLDQSEIVALEAQADIEVEAITRLQKFDLSWIASPTKSAWIRKDGRVLIFERGEQKEAFGRLAWFFKILDVITLIYIEI